METFMENTTEVIEEYQPANKTTDYVNSNLTDTEYENIEQFCISILLVCCLLAMCINCVVIISVNWITNSMSPNLKISVSLAIADMLSSSMTGVVLLLDKFSVRYEQLGIFPCLIELIRLSGIVITVLHLLALSFNHYIGILKPLHYNVIVTKRKVTTVIVILWIVPILVLIILSTLENNGEFLENVKDNTCTKELFSTFAVRLSYSALFFFPVILMVFCYTHILMAVRKQRNKWKEMSRSGSSRAKGRNVNSQKVTREQARLQGSIKAIHTTLLILGSCFVGWLPALLFYILTCHDCPISGETLNTLNTKYRYEVVSLRLIENMLIIMKMFANPIIYTIRIKEIKDSTNRMYLAAAGVFCPSRRPNTSYGLASSHRSSRNHTSRQSTQIRMNSLRTSGTESHVI